MVGLVDADALKPGDLVGVNKDSYLILDTLPSEYDSRVKAMEVGVACFCFLPQYIVTLFAVYLVSCNGMNTAHDIVTTVMHSLNMFLATHTSACSPMTLVL